MISYTLWDGDSPVKFVGTLLARSTSFTQHKDRWTETEIYVTQGGSYIVHKMGRSNFKSETTRFSVQISETAAGLIECLRFVDQDGVLTIRRVDRMALLEAIEKDQRLADAYHEGITVS